MIHGGVGSLSLMYASQLKYIELLFHQMFGATYQSNAKQRIILIRRGLLLVAMTFSIRFLFSVSSHICDMFQQIYLNGGTVIHISRD